MKLNLHKKRLKILVPIILGVILLATPSISQAAAGLDALKDPLNGIFQVFNIILIAVQAILWPILILIGGLLSNDLLFSGGMNTMLLNIWSAVRDFVNILFVMGLLAVAIVNIVGAGKEDLAIPKVLPKIAIALIAVNFSFLACKVVLDAVNIGTTAIFSIPIASDSLKKYQQPEDLKKLQDKFCAKVSKDPKEKNAFCEEDTAGGADDKTPAKAKLTDFGKEFFSTFNSRNVAIVMAVELMQIVELEKVDKVNADSLKNLTVNVIFSLIFLVIYGTAFIALFAALLVRVVVLWVAIALSPISFLGMAFGNIKTKYLKEDDPFFGLFMKHALIPLPVAVVLTIGMIMITQLKQMLPEATMSTSPAQMGALTSGMSTIQEIIAGLATAAFVWIAAFKAMEGTKASFLIDPIKGAVERFGGGLAKLPFYAPILPVKGKKVGLAALGSMVNMPQSYINKEQARYADIFGDKDTKMTKELEAATTASAAQAKIASILSAKNNEPTKTQQIAIAAALKKFPDLKLDVRTTSFETRDKLIAALKEGNVEQGDFKALLLANPNLKPAMPEVEAPKNTADKAVAAGKNAPPGMPKFTELDEKIAELEGKTKKMVEDAKDPKNAGAVEKLRGEVQILTNEVKELAKARDTFAKTNVSGAFDASGIVTDATKAQNISTEYRKFLTSVKNPKEAEGLLKRMLQDEGVTAPDTLIANLANGENLTKPESTTPPAPAP